MASLAEMERELTIERTHAGLEVARKLGRKGGRKRQMTDSKIKSATKLLESGVPPRDVAEQSRRLGSNPVSVDSGLLDGLTYDMVHFLKRPLNQLSRSGEPKPSFVNGSILPKPDDGKETLAQ
jgi:hypothetical protein